MLLPERTMIMPTKSSFRCGLNRPVSKGGFWMGPHLGMIGLRAARPRQMPPRIPQPMLIGIKLPWVISGDSRGSLTEWIADTSRLRRHRFKPEKLARDGPKPPYIIVEELGIIVQNEPLHQLLKNINLVPLKQRRKLVS